MIERVERFVCGHCGYITESKYIVALVKEMGLCPACQNGVLPKVWSSKNERKRPKS